MGRPPHAGVWLSGHPPGTAAASLFSVPVIQNWLRKNCFCIMLSMLCHADVDLINFFLYESCSDVIQ